MKKAIITPRNGDICPSCEGTGHTQACAPEVSMKLVNGNDGKKHTVTKTKKQGSGCMRCLGLGVL